jgi:hypothetical protein
MYGQASFAKLIGQTPVEIDGMKEGSEEVTIVTKEGGKLTLRYEPDCCASCSICQVDGDPMDLLGLPLQMCEESGNVPDHDMLTEQGAGNGASYHDESYTWTFVRFATVAGYVTLRWYGSSNGYYREAPTAYYEGPGADDSTRRGW